MLIIMKKTADEEALDHVKEFLINRNFDIHQSTGANRIIIVVHKQSSAVAMSSTLCSIHYALCDLTDRATLTRSVIESIESSRH